MKDENILQHESPPTSDSGFNPAVYQSAIEYHSESESDGEASDSQLLDFAGLDSNYAVSTWQLTPTKILIDGSARLEIRMEPDETLAITGEYHLRVKAGVVMLCGALLRAPSRSYRVFAPSTHALPLIECVRHVGTPAIIEISSCASGIQALAQLSPLFGRIWHAPKPAMAEPGSWSKSPESRSFRPVSRGVFILFKG